MPQCNGSVEGVGLVFKALPTYQQHVRDMV